MSRKVSFLKKICFSAVFLLVEKNDYYPVKLACDNLLIDRIFPSRKLVLRQSPSYIAGNSIRNNQSIVTEFFFGGYKFS